MKLAIVALITLATVATVTESFNVLSINEHGGAMNRVLKNIQQQKVSANSLRLTSPQVQASYFDNILDHFGDVAKAQGKDASAKWKQRYFLNNQYWKGPGYPIFLMVGGEGAVSSAWVTAFNYVNFAKAQGALLITLEHRFYGTSQPTGDLTTASLQFLTSQQALADLADFIRAMTVQLKAENSKWVTFGGSYPGSLSAWARSKYPELVHASVSTSGPVEAKLDFFEYLEVVRDDLHTFGGDACVAVVEGAFAAVDELAKDSTTGWDTLSKTVNACAPLKSLDDVGTMASVLQDAVMGIMQYNLEGSGLDAAGLCKALQTYSSKGQAPLAAFMSTFRKEIGHGSSCIDVSYQSSVDMLLSTVPNPSELARAWVWQTCNEFGYYQTSDSPNQKTFGSLFPLSISLKICSDAYGIKFDLETASKTIAATNQYYGGAMLQATNTFFSQGSVDPWHALGISSAPTTSCDAVIGQWAHCATMNPYQFGEPSELQAARSKISAWLDNVLRQPKQATQTILSFAESLAARGAAAPATQL